MVRELWGSNPGKGIIYLSRKSRPPQGPNQLIIHWTSEALSPRIKLPRHNDKHSSESSVEVKNEWTNAPTPPM
jgi:hypothetical protein